LKRGDHRDILSSIGFPIFGMTTVQMYLKVHECRTPAHQENNNFVSGNLSFGPGNVEWFAVDKEHEAAIQTMCMERKLNFLTGSWWPNEKDLENAKIPYYRFMQKPGDYVYTNMGTIHWVRSAGRAVAVAWNLGPMTEKQLDLAWIRYNDLKTQKERSLVPMHRLTWNLIKDFKGAKPPYSKEFAHAIYRYAKWSMECQRKAVGNLEESGCKVAIVVATSEGATICSKCNDEVYNLYFKHKGGTKDIKASLFCYDCAMLESQKQEVECTMTECLDDLQKELDAFHKDIAAL